MLKKLFGLLCLSLFVVSLTACNTAEGVGEDMEDAGDEIQDAMD